MRECKVCGLQVEETISKCPYCGFKEVDMLIDSPEDWEEEKNFILDYTEELLQPVRIGFRAYAYKEQGDKVVLDKEYVYTIAEGKSLKTDVPVWYNEQFSTVDRDAEIDLEITDIHGKAVNKTIIVKTPPKTDLWKIGVVLKDHLRIQILIGDETTYAQSDSFSLVK